MGETYVDAAQRGKHTWPRYLLGSLLSLFLFGIGSGISLILILALGSADDVTDISSWLASLGYVQLSLVTNTPFPFFLGGIVLTVTSIHRRSLRTLVTPRGSINKKRIAQGFGVWFALICVLTLVGFLLDPSSYSFGLNLAAFIPFALVALILTPIQTTTEELFFRGYLMQGASLISRSPIFLIVVSAVAFMVPHLANPEAIAAGLVLAVLIYLPFGVFYALISLKDGTIELAIGAHAANNLFLALVFNYRGGALGNTPAIFHADQPDPLTGLVYTLAICILFYLLVFVVSKREQRG